MEHTKIDLLLLALVCLFSVLCSNALTTGGQAISRVYQPQILTNHMLISLLLTVPSGLSVLFCVYTKTATTISTQPGFHLRGRDVKSVEGQMCFPTEMLRFAVFHLLWKKYKSVTSTYMNVNMEDV